MSPKIRTIIVNALAICVCTAATVFIVCKPSRSDVGDVVAGVPIMFYATAYDADGAYWHVGALGVDIVTVGAPIFAAVGLILYSGRAIMRRGSDRERGEI